MGKFNKNILAKSYIGRNDVFVDLVNLSLFDGERFLSSCDIQELDPIFQNNQRDILKKCRLKSGEVILVGIEIQSFIDPTMPVRIMEYDALTYKKLLKRMKGNHERNKLKKGEFLSGIKFTDRIHRVITLVLNLSGKRWLGAKSITEMLDYSNWVSEYKIRILDPYLIGEKILNKCSSGVEKLLRVLKYSQHEIDMLECLKREEYRELDEECFMMIKAYTRLPVKIKEKEDVLDMCKAVEDMIKHSVEKGKLIGLKCGQEKERSLIVKRMIDYGLLTTEVIALLSGLSVNDVEEMKAEY